MLEVKNLSVSFSGMNGTIEALQNVSFSAEKGEIVGIVGESGSGKSVTALSLLGLLDENATITNGEIRYNGTDITNYKEKQWQTLRGKEIAMVFQEPMTALHPTMRIGKQLVHVIRKHHRVNKEEAWKRMIQLLRDVHIHDPERVAHGYPFELSGGMRQRIVIALAMVAPPHILIADEATTALDVTIQYEILKLIRELSQKRQTTVLVITHDLGVVSQICDSVVVMYAGSIVERGAVRTILDQPRHPYTKALLRALPDGIGQNEQLQSIAGEIVDLRQRPTGCAFANRCEYAIPICRTTSPTLALIEDGQDVACFRGGETL